MIENGYLLLPGNAPKCPKCAGKLVEQGKIAGALRECRADPVASGMGLGEEAMTYDQERRIQAYLERHEGGADLFCIQCGAMWEVEDGKLIRERKINAE